MKGNILSRLRVLEKQFNEDDGISKRAEEINKLLKEYEEVMRPLRESPNSVALELELADEVVRQLVEEGYLENTDPPSLAEKPVQQKKEAGG